MPIYLQLNLTIMLKSEPIKSGFEDGSFKLKG